MKQVVFYRNPGPGSQPYEQVFEFDDDATEKEIIEEYMDWVWQEIGEQFTWYLKDKGDD